MNKLLKTKGWRKRDGWIENDGEWDEEKNESRNGDREGWKEIERDGDK